VVDQLQAASASRRLLVAFRVSLVLMALVTACADWFYTRAERWDTPPLIPVLAVMELPLFAGFLLVLKSNQPMRAIFGAGLAFGAATFSALAAPFLAFDAGFTAWTSRGVYKNLVAFQRLQLAIFIIGIPLMILSWRFGKGKRVRFWTFVGISIAYLFVSMPLLAKLTEPGSGARKEQAAWATPSQEAYRDMMALGGCLIRGQALHSNVGFPHSLAQIPADWKCDRKYARAQPVLQYTLDYTPRVDASDGRATDFRLVVVPLQNAGGRIAPLMMDRRGILFAYADWEEKNTDAHVAVYSGSALPQLQKHAEKFKSEHGGQAPASFRVLPDLQNWWPRPIEGDGKTIRMDGAYDYLFSEALPQNPGSYAISAICEDYAHSCILSYFLDYDGVTHETNQPRHATKDDPVMSACETDYLECVDVDWLLPDAPSRLKVISVSIVQTLNSTSLW
jgi:hypothetical protein